MKKDIHPTYHKETKVKCACGAEFLVGSTEPEIHVEICSACHPFFTGKQKLVDTAGRVDKFKAKVEAAKKAKDSKKKRVNSETKDTASTEGGAGAPASEGMRGGNNKDK